jgi:hypothetical protein
MVSLPRGCAIRPFIIAFVLLVACCPLLASASSSPALVYSLQSPDASLTHAEFGKAVAIADVDGDGIGDLVVGAPQDRPDMSSPLGSVFVFSGQTGTLIKTLRNPGPASGDSTYGGSLVAGDLNGDGKAEILVGDADFIAASLHLGRVYLYSSAGAPLTVIPNPDSSSLYFGAGLALADFNNDGAVDFAAASRAHVHVYSGSGSEIASIATASASDFRPQIAAGDFDADGYGDVAMGEGSQPGSVELIFGPDGSRRSTIADPRVGSFAFGAFLVSGDFDGDGKSDLAINSAVSNFNLDTVDVFSGPGVFRATILNPSESELIFGLAGASADLDGDGSDDLILGTAGASLVTAPKIYIYDGQTLQLRDTIADPQFPPVPDSSAFFGRAIAIGRLSPATAPAILVSAPEHSVSGRAYLFSYPAQPVGGTVQVAIARPGASSPVNFMILGGILTVVGLLGAALAMRFRTSPAATGSR